MADFERVSRSEVGHHLRSLAGSGPSKHRCRAESHWGHCADVWVALYMRLVKMILLRPPWAGPRPEQIAREPRPGSRDDARGSKI